MKEVNGFKEYLKEIGKYPLLDGEQELELGRRIADGDEEARQELINCNLRLVVALAKKYKNIGVSFEDLVADGNLGLITAVEKFDYTLGYRFSTCAIPWIKQAITKSLTNNSRAIRLPQHIYQQLVEYNKLLDKFAADGNLHPTDKELADGLGIDTDKLNMLRTYKQTTISLETPINDENEDTLADLQYDPDGETPESAYSKVDLKRQIAKLLDGLTPRTREIVSMRYGLGEWEPTEHTLEEVGEHFNLTRERIRQIVNEALRKMRAEWDG